MFHRYRLVCYDYKDFTPVSILMYSTIEQIKYNVLEDFEHIKTTQCKMSNLSNLFLKLFQGVRLIQNFIGQAQRESRLTKAVEHQEILQMQL